MPQAPVYVPVLKAREAEIKAAMKSPRSLNMTPLFELQQASPPSVDNATGLPKRAKTAITDATYFLDDIARLWGDPLYIDISRVSGSSGQHWWSLLASANALSSTPAELMPVFHLDVPAKDLAAAAPLAAFSGRAAVRIPMDNSPLLPPRIAKLTSHVAQGLNLPLSSIDTFLDWEDRTENYLLLDLESLTISAMSALSGGGGRVITLGTPNSASFVQTGDWSRSRREWLLWLRLFHAGSAAIFGDYALYPPADPVPALPQYGHLRYSSGNELHVHRRAQPRGGGGLGGAFADCCKHLVGQSHWLGAAQSTADAKLYDISNDAGKESTAGKWRQLAIEHHFSVVANQLTAPPPAPPTGTL